MEKNINKNNCVETTSVACGDQKETANKTENKGSLVPHIFPTHYIPFKCKPSL
jgi:hypothetical protein